MIAPGPTLETSRLILRPTSLEDFPGFCALMGDPDTARFIGGVQPPAMVWRGMAAMAGSWALQGFAMFSVLEKATGRWIGRVGPWMPEGWPGTEVGWSLLKDAQGRGYAVEAATATIDWAFDHLGWTDVIHTIVPENTASQQVARRLGSPLRGPGRLPPPFESSPVEIWGQRREEWRARRG
ncbi:GNAT family N-acetyltransferase [Myxococcus sp. K15C18031901]|uniref:GNAT family N-acetyltransferase n=1 Tax=Myxococcus dinghuensis TaxID=2906761 RepID=UPI0020A813EB|nr:GNAT family N-acetyltransferase [Myxococcus dinghuensis]MCP3100270.1 GNAT family N-acetyltransferase [Myxococcus dinghuensis]